MQAKVSDDEFMRLWDKHQSVTRLSEILGQAERSVSSRRQRLERRYQTVLSSPDPRSNRHAVRTLKSPRLAYQLQDGTAVIFSDAHFWPGLRTTAFRALLRYCKLYPPKLIVCNGDAFDGARISRYPHGEMYDSRPSVMDELRAVKEALGEIEQAAPQSVKIWTLGNHDARYESRLASTVPEFAGVNGFHLKDHFPEWTPTMSLWVNDDVVIKHRFKSGIHATHNNTVWAGKSIITGHLHSLKVTPFDDYNGTRYGVDTGTLADLYGPQFTYNEDNPVNWRSGFIVLTFHDGVMLEPEKVQVMSEGLVQFRGKVYEV